MTLQDAPLGSHLAAAPLGSASELDLTPWRRIFLTDHLWTLVDVEDYYWLIEWKWNRGGSRIPRGVIYPKRNITPARSTVYMHREILLRFDPRAAHEACALLGDHANGCTLDNRMRDRRELRVAGNLRWATPRENRANTRPLDRIPSVEFVLSGLMRKWCACACEIPF
jgi:hypothetical protein